MEPFKHIHKSSKIQNYPDEYKSASIIKIADKIANESK